MGRILFINPRLGIAGDMLVGALLNLGADQPEFWEQLKSLPVPTDEWDVSAEQVVKSGISATKFNVDLKKAEHAHDHEHGHGREHKHAHDHGGTGDERPATLETSPEDDSPTSTGKAPETRHSTPDRKSAEASAKAEPHSHSHGRNLPTIIELIKKSAMTEGAQELAINTFTILANAEAEVHATTPDKVHFHEVGAVDAIADICGAAIAVDLLEIESAVAAPPALGGGTVTCDHGTMAVPVPAVCKLIEGVPSELGPVDSELTTPTGAALLRAMTEDFSARVAGTVLQVGYGAGTKEFDGRANVLQVMLYESEKAELVDDVWVVECNIDDMPGEILSHVGPELLQAGALDYSVIPCTVKKSRQGMILQCIVGDEERDNIVRILLRETTTFGVRFNKWHRAVLRRETMQVQCPFGPVAVKIGYDPMTDEVLQVAPEYDSCKALADRTGIALKKIFAVARSRAMTELTAATRPDIE